jgi:hypothetical protein
LHLAPRLTESHHEIINRAPCSFKATGLYLVPYREGVIEITERFVKTQLTLLEIVRKSNKKQRKSQKFLKKRKELCYSANWREISSHILYLYQRSNCICTFAAICGRGVMNRKLLFSLLLVLGLAVGLGACGGGDTTTPAPESPTPTPTAT